VPAMSSGGKHHPSGSLSEREARRQKRIGMIVFAIVLVVTALAWTGVSLKDVLAKLHF
jgi:hypothetical protein